MPFVIFIIALLFAGLVTWIVHNRQSRSWMDTWEKQLQQQEKENEHDEGTVQAVGGSGGGAVASDGGSHHGIREGSKGTRQGSGGPDAAVCSDAGQAGDAPARLTEAKAKTEVIRILITDKLAYLERDRRSTDIIAKYNEISRFDPILAKLLMECDYASIKPMRKVLDHLRRKEILRLVPNGDKGDKQ